MKINRALQILTHPLSASCDLLPQFRGCRFKIINFSPCNDNSDEKSDGKNRQATDDCDHIGGRLCQSHS